MDEQKKQAVALKYQPGVDSAPRVLATGQGEVAERIIKQAQKSGIPLHEDPNLTKLLKMLPVGAEIPPELYAAVAEVLVFICDLSQKKAAVHLSGEL
jgi:flagellar biosynthesis protein